MNRNDFFNNCMKMGLDEDQAYTLTEYTKEIEDEKHLTKAQERKAVNFYKHLLEHPEVKNSPVNPGEAMCMICKKTATQILEGRKK